MGFFIVYFAFVGVVLAVFVGLSFVPAYQDWLLTRLAFRIGIGVPVDLDPSFRRRSGARIRASSIGGIVGLLIAAAVVASLPDLGFRNTLSIAVLAYGALAVSVVGSSIGITWAALRGSVEHRDDRPRVARLRVSRPADYVAPLPRRLAYAGIGFAAVTMALLALAPKSRGSVAVFGADLAVFVFATASIVAFPAIARWIIDKGRETTTTDEMVWDDALRAESLHDLLGAPVQALGFGLFYGALFLDTSSSWALLSAVGGLISYVVFSIALRNNRDWFLRRLWAGARRRTDDEEAARLAAATTAAVEHR